MPIIHNPIVAKIPKILSIIYILSKFDFLLLSGMLSLFIHTTPCEMLMTDTCQLFIIIGILLINWFNIYKY